MNIEKIHTSCEGGKEKAVDPGDGRCGGGATCPTMYRDQDGSYIGQGYIIDNETREALRLPEGEDAVRFPKQFMEEFLEIERTKRLENIMSGNVELETIPMTLEEFGEMFQTFSNSAFRLQTFQQYIVDNEDGLLDAYLSGELKEPITEETRQWRQIIADAVNDGKAFQNVHVVAPELSPYLKMCMEWGYRGNVEAGGDYRFVELSETPEAIQSFIGKDFWLFDDQFAVLMNYDPDGTFRGVERIVGDGIQLCSDIRALAMHSSISFKEYLAKKRH